MRCETVAIGCHCAVEDVDCLITAPSADGAVVDALRERGCDVAITV
jgi:hypothetical protein